MGAQSQKSTVCYFI